MIRTRKKEREAKRETEKRIQSDRVVKYKLATMMQITILRDANVKVFCVTKH